EGDESVPKDLSAARMWAQRAADQNYSPGQFLLAAVTDDIQTKQTLLGNAAALGYAPAQRDFAHLLMLQIRKEDDIAKDDPRSRGRVFLDVITWLTRAAVQGEQTAQIQLAQIVSEMPGASEEQAAQAHFWLCIALQAKQAQWAADDTLKRHGEDLRK